MAKTDDVFSRLEASVLPSYIAFRDLIRSRLLIYRAISFVLWNKRRPTVIGLRIFEGLGDSNPLLACLINLEQVFFHTTVEQSQNASYPHAIKLLSFVLCTIHNFIFNNVFRKINYSHGA